MDAGGVPGAGIILRIGIAFFAEMTIGVREVWGGPQVGSLSDVRAQEKGANDSDDELHGLLLCSMVSSCCFAFTCPDEQIVSKPEATQLKAEAWVRISVGFNRFGNERLAEKESWAF